MKIKHTYSSVETELVGYELGLLLKDEARIVILLDGDLGTGKTTLTKGLARAIGITKNVNSPSFTIMKKYTTPDGMSTLHHLDLYRLEGAGSDFDLEEYIDGTGMIVIEWPFKVTEFMPKDYLYIHIKTVNETERVITIDCIGYPCKRAVQYI
jgi:tRNA threonylcarbamoyladenosine biosynthesis protein TsaE